MTHDAEDLSDVSTWVPSSIEPGAPDRNYRDIAEKYNMLSRQRLMLDLDELAERYGELLCIATFNIPVEGDEIHWELCDIRLDPLVVDIWGDEALKRAERAVVEIIRLLQENCAADTAEMIANLLYDFGGSNWTPDLVDEMCRTLSKTLGLDCNTDVWLSRHRSHRQAKRLAEAVPTSSVSSARTRL